MSNLSMGVYLFQQFVLKYLYYKTPFTTMISPYVFPWLAFGVALVLSILLSLGVRRIKVGRFLIG